MILKLQRPMMPADAPWLVYSKDRSINVFLPADEIPSTITKAMGGGWKLYAHAERDGDGRLIFGKPTEEQGW